MANAYKNVVTAVATTDITTVYTCPTETVALIKSISVYNVSASVAIDVTLSIYDKSGDVTKAYEKKASLAAVTKYEFLQTGYSSILVLEESDLLRVTCSTANGLNVMVSVLQQDRT
jgi:hypothetical protein